MGSVPLSHPASAKHCANNRNASPHLPSVSRELQPNGAESKSVYQKKINAHQKHETMHTNTLANEAAPSQYPDSRVRKLWLGKSFLIVCDLFRSPPICHCLFLFSRTHLTVRLSETDFVFRSFLCYFSLLALCPSRFGERPLVQLVMFLEQRKWKRDIPE